MRAFPGGDFVQRTGDTITGQLIIRTATDPPLIIDRSGAAVGELIRLRTNSVDRGQIAGNSIQSLVRLRDGGGVDRWGWDMALGKLLTGTVPLARMQTAEASAENGALVTIGIAQTTIVLLPSMTVAIGDRILIAAFAPVAKDATASFVNLSVVRNAGTATVQFFNNRPQTVGIEQDYDHPASVTRNRTLSGIGRVTAAGTLTLEFRGISGAGNADVAAGAGEIHAIALQGT